MKIKALFFSLLIFSKVVMSQTGTIGSPFTSLYQARTLTTPGTYYFNLGGTTFNTYVAADGWLLVAIDFVGAPAGNLPQVNSLTTATRAILTPSVLTSLTEIKRVKISTSNGTTNAVTTNTTIVSRVKNNQTLNSVIADNALLGAGTWVGTGAAGLNGLLGGNSTGPLGLHAQVIHGVNNGGLLHWQPAGGYRSSPDYFTIPPAGTSFNLWVQAADMPGGINGELWYKADADVMVATGVSVWKDQTHNAINLTQATTTKQPVINNTGALMINFNPSIAFDGTDDVVNTATISQSLVIGGVTPNFTSSNFIVYRSPNSTNGILCNQSNGSGGIWNIGMNKNSGIITNRSIGSIPVTANDIKLQSLIGNANTSASINVNGIVNSTSLGSSVGTAGNSPFWVGAQGTNGFSASHIAEIIVYPSDLSTTATNKQRIESYLGLKYGISLPFNYVASDNSTVFWNTTTAASYSNNIAGIGKDAISGLEQKQSQSQNAGNQVIFGLGTVVASNAVNTSTFTADKQFMAWGDNNLTNGAMFVESADPSINYKINRVWFAQNTNSFNQAVQLLVPASLFGAASSVSKVLINKLNSSFPNDGSNIVVSATATTTVNTVEYYAFNLSASQVSSNFYFTLAKTCSPVVSIVSTPTAICVGSTATISATLDKSNGLLFNGTTTTLNTPNIISTQMPANDVTVELWFKPTTAGVIMNELGNSGWQITQMEVSTTGEVKVRVYNLAAVSLGTVALNTWNHVALRYSTVGTKLDGVLNGIPSLGSTIGPRDRSGATNYKFGLIGGNNMGTNTMFNGAMDEIRIWKVARTNVEIASNMNKVLPATSANLVAYYQFNESSGSTTADATAALNTGTIVSTAGFLIPSTAPVGNSYVWSTSATTSSIVVTPTVTTTYSLQITDAENCQGTQTFSLNVNALPTISVAANPTVICTGSPSTLTASGASTYTWTSGPSTSTNTVTIQGTYTVTGRDGNGCVNTQTVSLLANGVPTLAVNNGSICSGDSYTITPSGASSYTYSGGSDIISPLITTNYTVVGSNTAGCVSSTTLSVEVNKKPNTVITGTNTICIGNSATLSTQFLGSAIGGVVTYSAGYAIHTFTSNGTFSVTGNLPVEYLIVAGGGGGGYRHGAGGGGGGLLTGSLSATAGSFPVVVGAGGAGGSAALPDGRNGSNSSALSFTAIGGGGGGSNDGPTPGNGGSGGGAPQGRTPGTGVSGQGFSGGAGSATNYNHGGGGGAGGVGVAGTNTQSGNGGPGLLSNISGSAAYYAGGGGGGDHQPASALQALGGIGGGGKGGVPNLNNPGENGLANTGGGGGGASTTSGGNSNGGNGGSGIVIISYLLSNTGGEPSSYAWSTGATTSSITVTPTVTTTYSVVATSTAGCVGNTSVFTVSVNALPVVTAAANPTTICGAGTSTLTAGGASTYTWTSGPSTSTNTTTSAGTYTVSGTDGNGCVNTQTVNLVVNALPTLAVSNGTICVGDSFTITPSGASTYSYSGGSSTVSPTTSTNYTVTGTNVNGCVNTQTVSLVVNALPVVTAVANPTAICVGGTATLTAGGASTYTWTSGPSTSTNTATSAGTYTVTGTNANGCVNTQTINLVVNALPVVTAVANPTAICVGATSTLTAGGASTYVWTSGPSASTNTVSTAGTYTVTGTNGNGCVNTQTVNLVVNALPVVTAVANPTAICTGGTSTLTAGGASTYVWTSGPSTSTNTVNTAGTYTVSGTNGNGCVNTQTVSLVVNALPVLTAVASPTAICVGGTSTLTAGGASTYVWTSGPSTSTNTVSAAGTYTVTGTNGNGCLNTQTVNLVVNALPVVTTVANPTAICIGGTSTLTAGGASTYVWTSGPSASTNTVSTAGTYTVTGTNGNGCVNTQTVNLVVNALPVVTAVANPTAICVGGTSTLTAGGASTYVWTSGPSASTNTVSTAGTYTVTGTNGNGCASTQTVSLAVNALPVVTAVANPTAICVGGTSTLTAGGASTYVWTSGPSTSTNTVSTAGTYTVTGTNGNGCVNTKTVSLVVNSLPVVTAVATPTAICVGGTSTLTAGGASTYVWTSGPSTSTNTASSAGTYTVTGTNGNGCVNTQIVSLVVNALPVVTAVATPTAICVGGTSTLTAGGASTYVWTSGPSTSTNTVSTAGTYTVTGTNGNGCVNTQTVSLAVNSNPTLALGTVKNVTCLGSSTGSISTVASGGASGYSYAWTSAVSSTNTATGLLAGVYTTTVTDANGCKATLTNTVAAPSTSLSASIATSTTGCGFANGTASLTATGGWNTGYTYQWQSIVSTTTLGSGYAAGTYTTNVTDANGCSIVKTFTISNPTTPTVNVVASSSLICSGQTTTLTPSGAVSYTLVSPSTTFTSNVAVSPMTTTVYNISGSDASNCISGIKSITITVNTTPTVALVASSASICIGNTPTLTPSGANTYTLINTGASITTNTVVSPISTTIYTVTGTSTAGCISTPTAITVSVNSNPTLVLGTLKNVSCLGSSTGSISTVASGGASGYSYIWTSAVSSTNTATGLLAGVYTTTVTDANGCKATLTNTVAAPSTSLSASIATSTTGCGFANGTATVTAAGGWNPGYTYQWQSSVSTTTLGSGYAAGTYTTNVTDANGCSIVKTFTISNPTTPTVNIVASSSVICSGQTTTLTPSGAVSYTLTSPSTTFTSNVAVSPMTTTVYNISGSDASNCVSGLSSVTITVNTTPTVSLSSSSVSICIGNTPTVTPSGANTYTLVNTGASITTNTVVSPISTAVYTVTGTSTAGCVSSPAVITVTVNANPTITLSTSNATICNGNSSTLTALGTDTYTWTSGPNTSTFIVSPSSATVYSVVGTNTLTGCVSSTSTTTISVNPTPVLTVSATALSVCSNGTVNLNVSGATTYTWSGTGISGSNVNSSNPIFAAPSSNTYVYSVIGTNTVSCPSAVNTITITIIGSPNSSLVASSQNICEGGNATFSIVPQPGVTYNWLSPSVLSNTTGVYLVPSTISNVAGNYSVNVVAILGTGSNTCSTSSTGNLVVFATPTISLSQNSISVCDGEAVSLNVNNPLPSPANYNWSYNNTNGTFIMIPQISLNESGTYTVTVTDVNGCENSSTVQILVKSCGYEIPVLLTPNDDGKNDAFVIKNIQLYPNCKVQIFNRWGSAIYSKVGYQNDWKGTFDLGNGGKLPAATYFILIEFNDGETKPYQGYIQIEY